MSEEAIDMGTVTAETFAGHEGSLFTVVAGEERRALELLEVTSRPHLVEGLSHPDGSPLELRVPFTLTFAGPRAELFGQATVEVHHTALGRLILFLKPFAEDQDRVFYESIFS